MKYLLTVAFLLLVAVANAGTPTPTKGSEVGRYQAIVFEKKGDFDNDKVLILDTKDGHLWVWSEQAEISGVRDFMRSIIYHGKLTPGKKMGDVVEMYRKPTE